MRKSIAGLVLASLLLGAAPADAASFKNCADLRKSYPYGVSQSATTIKRVGNGIFTPKTQPSVYKANRKLDVNRDGIACEVARPKLPNPKPPASEGAASESSTVSGFSWKTYRGGAGGPLGSFEFQTPELQFRPAPATGSVNLKLWLYHPDNPVSPLGQSAVFLLAPGKNWEFVAGNSDGTNYLSLADGSYTLDTIEPGGDTKNYVRARYTVEVTAGKAMVRGVKSNNSGFFGLTVQKQQAPQSFRATNQCQLEGQDGNLAMNQGFPARSERLPRTGAIRALVIPVDFPDVPSSEDPLVVYREMAQGTHDFYSRASGGKVSFEFEVLPKYVRLPFDSAKYNLGTWSSGDADGYWKASIREADPLVDYSKFDVVYVLSPRSIPWSSIAYGPALLNRVQTEDGYVQNGSFSGADAYQAFPGAGWKWMAHETGHLFGLHDLYTVDPKAATYGSWDLMSLNWSTKALELNSWNRFILNWLPEGHYKCLSSGSVSTTETLIPLVENREGVRAIFKPLSPSEILVIESRVSGGLDTLPAEEEGVLVYTVDMKIPSICGGWKVQRPARSNSPTFEDAALRPGEFVLVQGVKVEVVSRSGSQFQVKVG